MKAIMLDLEFLDTKPTGAILTLGAVVMDLDKLIVTDQELYLEFDPDDCMRRGMTASADTIAWWLKQDIAVVKEAFNTAGRYKHSLELGLVKVSNFFNSIAPRDKIQVHSCGLLDMEILKHGFYLVGDKAPWDFWNERDFRTMREEFPPALEPTERGPKHNALADAKTQAHHLIAIKKHIASLNKAAGAVAGKQTKARAPTPVVAAEDDDEL